MSQTFAIGDLTIRRVIVSEGPLFDPLVFFPDPDAGDAGREPVLAEASLC